MSEARRDGYTGGSRDAAPAAVQRVRRDPRWYAPPRRDSGADRLGRPRPAASTLRDAPHRPPTGGRRANNDHLTPVISSKKINRSSSSRPSRASSLDQRGPEQTPPQRPRHGCGRPVLHYAIERILKTWSAFACGTARHPAHPSLHASPKRPTLRPRRRSAALLSPDGTAHPTRVPSDAEADRERREPHDRGEEHDHAEREQRPA